MNNPADNSTLPPNEDPESQAQDLPTGEDTTEADHEGQQAQDEHTSKGGQRFWAALGLLFVISVGVGILVATNQEPAQEPVQAPAAPPEQEKRLGKPLRAGLVRGQVVTAGRLPLANATITLTPLSRRGKHPHGPLEVKTDSQGRFAAGPVARLGHKLQAEADGHLGHTIERLIPGGEPITIELLPGRGLRGRAVLDGMPIPNARVRVAAAGVWPQKTFSTGPNGTFTTTPLPPGEYQIMVRHQGDGGLSHGAQTILMHDGLATAVPIDIELAPAVTAQIQVLDAQDDSPLAGALVTLAEDVVHVLSISDWSNGQGEVTLYGLPRGRHRLTINAPGYLPIHPELDLSESGQVESVQARLQKAATLSGMVTNKVGSALEMVQLIAHVTTESGQQWLHQRDPTFAAGASGGGAPGFEGSFGFYSDENGRFEIIGLPPGSVIIEARREGFVPAFAGPFTLQHNGSMGGVRLEMAQGYKLEGRVLGPEEEPVGLAQVRVSASVEEGQTSSALPGMERLRRRMVVTDPEGRFVIEDLPRNIALTTTAQGYLDTTLTLDLVEDNATAVEIRLERPGDLIQGRVSLEGQVGLSGVRLWHQPAPGQPARRVDVCMGVSDPDGRFALEGCPKEDFWVEVIPPGDSGAARRWVKMAPEPEEEVEINLPRGHDLLITTLQALDAEPVQDARLTLVPPRDPLWPRWLVKLQRMVLRSDADGLAIFEALPVAGYDLVVELEGYRRVAQRLRIEGQPLELEVELPLARAVSGGVIDQYGAPVPSTRVRVKAKGRDTVETITDERGRFAVELPYEDAATLHAVHPAHGRGQGELEEGTEPTDEVVIELSGTAIDIERWEEPLTEVGVTLWRDGNRVVVESVEVDTPAERAGLSRGDTLIELRRRQSAIEAELSREGKLLKLRITP